MKFDARLGSGLLIGVVLGLHFHASLISYLPILLVAVVAMVLKEIRH